MKPQIEPPPARGSAEGFDEWNSICVAVQFTTTLRGYGLRNKPSQLFALTTDPVTINESCLILNWSWELAERGRQR